MDCSPPGSSVHGILQASMLEWVARSSPNTDSPFWTQMMQRLPCPAQGSICSTAPTRHQAPAWFRWDETLATGPQHLHLLLFAISQGGWGDGKSVHLAKDWLLNTGQLLPSLGSWAHGLLLGFAICWRSQHLSFSFFISKRRWWQHLFQSCPEDETRGQQGPSTNPWISTTRALTLHTGKLPVCLLVNPRGLGSCGLIHPGI